MKIIYLVILISSIISCDKNSNPFENYNSNRNNNIDKTKISFSQSTCKTAEFKNQIDAGLTIIKQSTVQMGGSCPKDQKRYLASIQDGSNIKYEYLACLACEGETLSNQVTFSRDSLELTEIILVNGALSDCECTFIIKGAIENVENTILKIQLFSDERNLIEEANLTI